MAQEPGDRYAELESRRERALRLGGEEALLEGRAHGIQAVVGSSRREDLEAGGQPVLVGEAARERHAGHAGEVRRDRRDVVEVHRHRVVHLVAEAEGRRRRGR